MKHFILYVFLSSTIVIGACTSFSSHTRKEVFYDTSIKVDINNVPLDSTQFYFPLIGREDSVSSKVGMVNSRTIYSDPSRIDSFCNRWYSKHLFRMNEPLLFNKPFDSEIIRITWLRTFDNPIVFTLEKKMNKYTLHWKRCGGMGGYDPGTLVENKSKEVYNANWEELNKELQKTNFWNKQFAPKSIMMDGAISIIEVAGPDYYWLKYSQGFSSAGQYLLSLTDMWIPKKDIY